MAEQRPSDATYDGAIQQQQAEEHVPASQTPSEMVESARTHHETDGDLPTDEREHRHETPPLTRD